MSLVEVEIDGKSVESVDLEHIRSQIADGRIDGDTRIRHPSLTDGRWRALRQTTLVTLLPTTPGGANPDDQTPEKLLNRANQYREILATKPALTWSLIGLNALVLLVIIALSQDANPLTLLVFGAKDNLLIERGQWWRLFSATVLHANAPHLLLNLFALYILGRLAESVYGSIAFLGIYLSGGLAGSLASYLFSQHQSVGSSGAIFGLIGATLVFSIRFRRELPAKSQRFLLFSLVFWLGFTLYIGFTRVNIDNFAHLGGLCSGLLLGLLLPTRLSGDRVRKLARVPAGVLTVMLLGLFGWSLFSAGQFVLGSGFYTPIEGKRIEHAGFRLTVPVGWPLREKTKHGVVVTDWIGSYFQIDVQTRPRSMRSVRQELQRMLRAMEKRSGGRVRLSVNGGKTIQIRGRSVYWATIRVEKNGRLLVCETYIFQNLKTRTFLQLYVYDRYRNYFDRHANFIANHFELKKPPR